MVATAGLSEGLILQLPPPEPSLVVVVVVVALEARVPPSRVAPLPPWCWWWCGGPQWSRPGWGPLQPHHHTLPGVVTALHSVQCTPPMVLRRCSLSSISPWLLLPGQSPLASTQLAAGQGLVGEPPWTPRCLLANCQSSQQAAWGQSVCRVELGHMG